MPGCFLESINNRFGNGYWEIIREQCGYLFEHCGCALDQNVVARSNEHYGIPGRRFVTHESKVKTVTQSQLDRVRDEYVHMSLELQQAFGLCREEAMKFQPSFAGRGDHLVLKASWTKGGRGWMTPVRTEVQRDVVIRARRLAGLGSLIPSNRNYRQQMRIYEGNTCRVGDQRSDLGTVRVRPNGTYLSKKGRRCERSAAIPCYGVCHLEIATSLRSSQ